MAFRLTWTGAKIGWVSASMGEAADPVPPKFYRLTVTVQNSPATGQPTISGTVQVGETLTAGTSDTDIADADGLSGATFSYQWLSSRDTEIQGATGAAYILVPGDAGKTIKVPSVVHRRCR